MKEFKRFSIYLKKYKGTLIFSFISAFLTAIAGMLGHVYFGKAMNQVIGKGNVQFKSLYLYLILMMFFYIIEPTFDKTLRYSANKLAYRAVQDIRNDAFDKLERLPLSYIDRHAHGDIMSRFTNDMDSVSEAITGGFHTLLGGFFLIVTCIITMLLLNPTLAVVVLLSGPVVGFATFAITKFTHNTYAEQQRALGDLTGYAVEQVGNQKVIAAIGFEETSANGFKERGDNIRKINAKSMFISSLVNPASRMIDHFVYIALGVVAAMGILSGKPGFDVGILSMFFVFAGQFSKPFNQISSITSQIQTAQVSLERIFELMDAKEEHPDHKNAVVLENAKGHVEFEHVDFSYTKNTPLIEDFNFEAKPGDLVAIVGPTGAGKTTLVNLLMRFYEIDDGSIKLDGIDTRDITRDSLRRQFGMVLQDTWLFSGTIADNIAYARPESTREQIIEAAKSAHADEFISELPDGYDTMIGESDDISDGQKQLLTIARVMLMDPPILILDEATSSVDTLTEVRLQKALDKIMEGRTSFVIAHRLSTIVSAKTILVLNKGNIVEQGSHQALMEKKGAYFKLYNSQFQ